MHTTHCHKTLRQTRTQGAGAAILCACLALSLLVISDSAQAARQNKGVEPAAGAPTKKKGTVKVKHQRSASEESTAERDRRMYRECKGLPNAGACLGYTRR